MPYARLLGITHMYNLGGFGGDGDGDVDVDVDVDV